MEVARVSDIGATMQKAVALLDASACPALQANAALPALERLLAGKRH
jgi:hypothetical protein